MGMNHRSQLTLGLPTKISSVGGQWGSGSFRHRVPLKGYLVHLLFEAETVPLIATEPQGKGGQLWNSPGSRLERINFPSNSTQTAQTLRSLGFHPTALKKGQGKQRAVLHGQWRRRTWKRESHSLHTHWATIPLGWEILHSMALISPSELSYLFVTENLCSSIKQEKHTGFVASSQGPVHRSLLVCSYRNQTPLRDIIIRWIFRPVVLIEC